MTVRDLLEKKDDIFGFKSRLVRSELIAIDSCNGKIVFDTTRNKKGYVEKYYDVRVYSLWSDVKLVDGTFGDFFKTVIKCHISHDDITHILQGDKE